MFASRYSYQLQGRLEEAKRLSERICEQFPDYLFGRVSQAQRYVLQGELDAAEALLKPFLTRKRFHFDEFAVLCQAFIQLLMAQKKLEGAKAWLGLWEQVAPEHPDLAAWKLRLAGSTLRKRLGKILPW